MKLHSFDDVRRLTAYLQTIADWKEGFERRAQRAQLQAETAGLDAAEQDRLLEEGRALLLLMSKIHGASERRAA